MLEYVICVDMDCQKSFTHHSSSSSSFVAVCRCLSLFFTSISCIFGQQEDDNFSIFFSVSLTFSDYLSFSKPIWNISQRIAWKTFGQIFNGFFSQIFFLFSHVALSLTSSAWMCCLTFVCVCVWVCSFHNTRMKLERLFELNRKESLLGAKYFKSIKCGFECHSYSIQSVVSPHVFRYCAIKRN